MDTLKIERLGVVAGVALLSALTSCTLTPPLPLAYPAAGAYPPVPSNAYPAAPAPGPGPGASLAVSPAGVASAVPTSPRAVWHSYDAILQRSPQGTITARGGAEPAVLEVYESLDDNGVRRGPLLDEFFAAPHYEPFNKLDHYWTERRPAANRGYPYVGKSMIPRGGDERERAAPPPSGVLDLQMAPPQTDHLIVAAFIVPVDGSYVVYDLAARRVSPSGGTIVYSVFNAAGTPVSSIQAGNDLTWVRDPQLYPLGPLRAGDRIFFAVSRDGDYAFDSTEVAFSVALVNS